MTAKRKIRFQFRFSSHDRMTQKRPRRNHETMIIVGTFPPVFPATHPMLGHCRQHYEVHFYPSSETHLSLVLDRWWVTWYRSNPSRACRCPVISSGRWSLFSEGKWVRLRGLRCGRSYCRAGEKITTIIIIMTHSSDVTHGRRRPCWYSRARVA